jgi:hypothetical protein
MNPGKLLESVTEWEKENNLLDEHPLRLIKGDKTKGLISIILEYKHESLFIGRFRYE